jgi:hypothetical protein
MTAMQQNPDGSWTPAAPIPYTDTIDWEISGRGRNRHGRAYWHDRELAQVRPGRWFRLRLILTHRRLLRAQRTAR